jgi:hypothetical protein
MTKHLMSWFLAKLSATALGLAQVQPYEGQFEDLEDTSVFPPAALVAITRVANDREASPIQLAFTASVYLVTTHIHGTSADDMLDLIDAAISALHDKPVRYELDTTPSIPPDAYFGRCFFTDGDFLGIMPGLAVYRLNFTIRK